MQHLNEKIISECNVLVYYDGELLTHYILTGKQHYYTYFVDSLHENGEPVHIGFYCDTMDSKNFLNNTISLHELIMKSYRFTISLYDHTVPFDLQTAIDNDYIPDKDSFLNH